MGIEQTLVEEIVGRILRVSSPDRVILFGSAAQERMTPDSDIDLLVLERQPANVRDERLRLRAALRGLGYPFDVVIMSTVRFDETKSVVGGLAYPANKYGRIIYEAA